MPAEDHMQVFSTEVELALPLDAGNAFASTRGKIKIFSNILFLLFFYFKGGAPLPHLAPSEK